MSQLLLTRSPYRPAFTPLSRGFRRAVPVGLGGHPRMAFARRKFVFGPSAVIVGLIFVVLFMNFLHLLHFNQVATKGYDLRRLEMDRQHLLEQFQIKNMHVAEIKSLAAISHSGKAQSMVKSGDVIFVRGDTALAFGKP